MPIAAATLVAFLVSLYLATVYLPSHTTTILQLRSGVIPTLKDRNFFRFRRAADQVTVITGSMLYVDLICSSGFLTNRFSQAPFFGLVWTAGGL